MYLREMGTVELLSREGEIAIAKRIEAGRDMMIGGLCESTQTFKAIVAWHEAVKDGRMLLRDVIDLEATATADNPEPPRPTRRRSSRRARRARRPACRFRPSKRS
jgi:RNA polymerase primary sigma factor